jgi:hypothetical protein
MEVKREKLPKLAAILTFPIFIHTTIFKFGWEGPFRTDAANHVPAVLRLIGYLKSGEDWYADSSSETLVHLFFAQIFRLYGINNILSNLFFFGTYLTLIFTIQLYIVRIFLKLGLGPIEILLLYCISNFFPKLHVYGYVFFVDPSITPRHISWCFSIIALYYIVDNKLKLAVYALFVSSLFHPSDTLVTGSTLALSLLILSFRHGGKKVIFLRLFTLPFIFPAFLFFVNYAELKPGESEEFAWSLIYFRAPYLLIDDFEIFALSVIVFVQLVGAILLRESKIVLISIIGFVSYIHLALWYIGVKTLNFELLQLYGIRALGLYTLTCSIVLLACMRKIFGRKISLTTGREMFVATILVFLILTFQTQHSLILETSAKVWKLEPTTLQKRLAYPCSLTEKSCESSKSLNSSNPKEVFLGNYVSIKQLGFGVNFYREWLKRLNLISDDCLAKRYRLEQTLNSFDSEKNQSCFVSFPDE